MESPSSLETRYRAAQTDSSPEPKDVRDSFFDDEPVQHESRRQHKKQTPKFNLGKLGKAKKWVIFGIVLVLVIWLGSLLWGMFNPGIPGVDAGKYQAVFLTDGTQYVGKLTNLDGSHYKLKNAYFVTANSTPVVSDQGSSQSSSNQVALVKLETGLLNAENEMTIPKDKVLFYENLKSDGSAAKLLDSDK